MQVRKLLLLTIPVLGVALWACLAGYQMTEEIDLQSARTRIRRTCWSIPISEQISETPLTKLAVHDGKLPPPIWRPVWSKGAFQPISPHYRHGGSRNALKQFDAVCELLALSPAERTAHGRQLLKLLQSDDPRAVEQYVQQLYASGLVQTSE